MELKQLISVTLRLKTLNRALLVTYYDIQKMGYPKNYLCPIPGRVDYIHYLADLLASSNNGIVPGDTVLGLDIG
jgi:23S rRNA (adenine1618-N6)-methyltransferase